MESSSKNNLAKIFISAAAVLVAVFAIVYFIFIYEPKTLIKIGGQQVAVQIADNDIERYTGLSDRKSLPFGEGMLFIFDGYDKRSFVMRRMNFPLDIVFIKDGMVTEVRKNCPPEGDKPEKFYESGAKVDMVLELPGGYCNKYGIEAGATMSFVKKR